MTQIIGRPRMLDMFCCAGGAAKGYATAGIDVVGVDIMSQPNYPFLSFHEDALDFAARYAASFDVFHASPPCQAYTTMNNRHRGRGTGASDAHPALIGPTRELLETLALAGKVWVIEGVAGARDALRNPILLHGGMFGLGVYRPRYFESNIALTPPPAAPRPRGAIGVYGARADGRRLWTRSDGTVQRAARSIEEARAAMGIDWMTWPEITEAIPPAYTHFIGEQIVAHLQKRALAA